MKNKIYIVFYKDNFKWWSRLIKWWTNSKYSHCEIYTNGQLIGISTEQNVRIKEQPLNANKWDIFELKNIKSKDVMKFFNKTKGKKYDWKGILLSQIFNFKRDNREKYTCSEWCTELIDSKLDIIIPKRYISITPQDLYEILKYKGLIQ